MPVRPATTLRRRRISVGAALTLVTAGLLVNAPPAGAASPPTKATTSRGYAAGRYIVTFADEPAASYEGTVAGYPRTRPDAGKKLDPTRPEVVKWRARLTSVHDSALRAVGAAKLADYTVATNGVFAELTAAQAARLAATPGVLRLERDARAQVDTTYSPEFLGLSAPGGLWSQLPGGASGAGQGVIVGVLDTGIWPESPSFAGAELKRDKAGLPVPASGLRGKWFGDCEQGENFDSQDCNDKLIGARFYTAGFGRQFIDKSDYLSPRDGDGHGSHTASTAAGNRVPNVTVDGKAFGTASGMAPGAKVAAYKVCWTGRGVSDGCFNSDSVAAIDDAVADGVDVINYSIGGSSESDVFDTVAQAFRRASNVGIFVANSAGNSGPGASTLDHPAPWVTTVAASTFRISEAVLQLGNGARYVGASITNGLPSQTPLVTAQSVKLAAAADDDARRCFSGTLDPAKAAGKVVLCDRGVSDRVAKGVEAKRAGAAAMVLANNGQSGLAADFHVLPAIHVEESVRTAVVDNIDDAASPTAAIVPLNPGESATQVPETAGFSSRGPSTTTEGDILKPDLAAPGVDVLAAVAPPFHFGRSYDFISGTSMSSPHVAGLGALLKAAHPTWTPAMVKSSLMTTGRDHMSTADPFEQGAGFVRPNLAVDPGLVFDATPNEYRQFLIGYGAAFSAPFNTLTPIDASDLNQASIASGAMAGKQTIVRTVTSVGSQAETYTVSATLPGITVDVDTSSFSIAPGAKQELHITLTRDDAPLGEWAKGNLTLTGNQGHVIRVPLAVRPVAIAAPIEITGEGASGSETFSVTPGFSGTLDTNVSGLVGAAPVPDSVATGPFDLDNPATDAGTKSYSLVIPAGTDLARFDLDAVSDSDDLDLYIYKDGEFVVFSASGAADEQVTLHDPEPGTYTAYVNGFATGGGGGYSYTQWAVPAGPVGNLTVDDNVAVTVAEPVDLTASWTGLAPGLRYLGIIEYGTGPERTIVAIG